MADESIPKREGVDAILADVDAIIGLSAAFPPSRFNLQPTDRQSAQYNELKKRIEASLENLRERGFPFFDRNHHETLEGMWAWCVSFGTSLGPLRSKPRETYSELIHDLQSLREVVAQGADAPLEVLRELRESMRRTNELFVIMAFCRETDEFYEHVVAPASGAVGLQPVVMNRADPEEPISDAILSSIRRSLLVLCDLTFARPNCYFEAGYAKGAFRRILFTARRDHDPRAGADPQQRVHFDVDQFRITWWDPADFGRAQAELQDRLRALVAEVRV